MYEVGKFTCKKVTGMSSLFTLWGEILIKSADAEEKISRTTEKAGNLKTQLSETEKNANKAGSSIGSTSKLGTGAVWLGNQLTMLTNKCASFAVNLGKLGFDYNAQMESYTTAFATMLGGSTEKAQAFIEDLRNLASKTPLQLEGIAGNAKTLMGFGVAAEDVIDTLRMLGDAAQGDQQRLNSIVLAYSQIMAAGKLNAQDANQLINAGFPIWNELASLIGATVGETRKLSEAGEISSDDVTKAFQAATSEGGKFYKQMEMQSKTFNGQVSTLKDNTSQTIGQFFQPFFDMAKSDILPKLSESLASFSVWITENTDTVEKFAESIGNLAAGGFDKALSFFQWAVENQGAVSAAFTAIAAAVGILVSTTHPWLAAIGAVLAGLVEISSLQKEIDDHMKNMGMDAQAYYENPIAFTFESQKKTSKSPFQILKEMNDQISSEKPVMEVQTELEPGSTSNLQGELNNTNLSVDVKVNPIWSAFLNFNKRIGLYKDPADGSHAGGLDRVPFDGYRAVLHKDEMVLKASEAAVYRGDRARASGYSRSGSDQVGNGQVVNVTQNIQSVPLSPSELAAQTKYALGLLRFSV